MAQRARGVFRRKFFWKRKFKTNSSAIKKNANLRKTKYADLEQDMFKKALNSTILFVKKHYC